MPGDYLGSCELNRDMTWRLEVRGDIEAQPTLIDALQDFHEGFVHLLDRSETLEDSLPYYAEGLHYYRRLLAAGLASSLSQSLALAGLTGKSSRQWLQNLSSPSLAEPQLP